jgi:hypothetical protein
LPREPVYSTNFFAVQGLTASVTYFVPSGKLLVLRDCDVYCNAGIAPEFRIIGDNAQTIWWVLLGIAAGGIRTAEWRGRQVCSDLLRITSSGDPVDATLSGYLLSLP